MSRIGRMPITVPPGVTVKIEGAKVNVKGPKGELSRSLPSDMRISLEGNTLTVSRPSDSKEHRSLHGLTRSLLSNMVDGVSKGFEKGLELSGVGFRAEKAGNNLMLRIGFSHTVEVLPLTGISFVVEAANRFKVTGPDKEAVGEMAAEIRAIRPPDAYKGKGIRYAGEIVHLKPGKAGKVVGRK
jgi:large subunit ribosomal protein L6